MFSGVKFCIVCTVLAHLKGTLSHKIHIFGDYIHIALELVFVD